MANKSKVQSVEPDIADLVNGWLKSYGLDYKLEQASLNSEIDKALDEYHSKSGGKGGNRPDAKLLLKDKYGTFYPVLIEYKGYKDKLVKLDTDGIVDNKKDKNEPNYTNIKSYAVNGAIHYANAILHYTSYTRIIAIGVTGYKDEFGKLQHEIGVYYVSADKNNLGFGQRVGDYTDLSFLKPSHFDEFVEKLNELSLTQAEIVNSKKSVKKKSISVLLNLTMTSTKKKQDWEKTIEYILLQLLSLQRLVQRALNLLKNLIWDLLPKAVKLTEIKSSEKLHLS